MRPYELNLFEEKILRNTKRLDKATRVSLLMLAKEMQNYLLDKGIETTTEEMFMIMILTMANNHGPEVAMMIQRHIASCKTFYEAMNNALQNEAEKSEITSPPSLKISDSPECESR